MIYINNVCEIVKFSIRTGPPAGTTAPDYIQLNDDDDYDFSYFSEFTLFLYLVQFVESVLQNLCHIRIPKGFQETISLTIIYVCNAAFTALSLV